MKTALITTVIVIAVVIASVWTFRYYNPGIYMKYKCNEGGDSSRKFYDPTWKARGAVCDGLWIPITAKLGGKNKVLVLEQMLALVAQDNNKRNDMRKLAEEAASQI